MIGRPLARAALVALVAATLSSPLRAAEAPYEANLVRLAEIMGSLHYLRHLCGEDGTKWRDEMQALLDAENPTPEDRSRLVASFNHGYRAFSNTYGSCTASAIEAIDRYVSEGEKLSRDTATRYGN